MSIEETSGAPLQGVRVLDFSRIIAGPLCTQQLADMGASVIKVENPTTGDDTRAGRQWTLGDESYFFATFNRNKRSLALDIRTDEGQAIVHELAAQADVLVENFRPGVMARFGLDYARLKTTCPNLIYLSISAYGQEGEMSDRPGFDPVLQAESGMMSITGEPDGAPMRHPISIIDTMTALQAVGAVTAALFARTSNGGKGQQIDLALMDVAIAALGNAGGYYLASGESPARSGNSHMTATPTDLFETKTGPLYIALSSNRLFGQLCRDVLELPELVDDERFASPAGRLSNRPALRAILQERFGGQSRDYWLQRMRHLPAGAVRGIPEALEDPAVHERGMVTAVSGADDVPFRVIGSPLNFSGTPLVPMRPAPALGADTDAILAELGRTTAQIEALRANSIVR